MADLPLGRGGMPCGGNNLHRSGKAGTILLGKEAFDTDLGWLSPVVPVSAEASSIVDSGLPPSPRE